MPDIPDLNIPDALTGKSFWQIFSVRDAIYIVLLVYMLLNQHFNNEQRLERLEDTSIQIGATLTKLTNRMDTEMVPRKENDSATQALNTRLGNIESAQNNMMTYLLNHGK